MKRVLGANFFNRKTVIVAEALLGKYLVRKIGRKIIALKIAEVEVYDGYKDKASHAFRGRTARNCPMFGPAGIFYVYFTYGIHWMLNVVTGAENYPAAILIRGTEEITGPARLTRFLKITGKLNAKKAERKSGLWFEDRGGLAPKLAIKKTPRIGVGYAGHVWSKKLYRFELRRN